MSYEPTTWKKGDKVTSTRLNKIENGIQGNDSEITALKEDLNNRTGGMNVAINSKTGRVLFFDGCDADANFFSTSGNTLEVTGSNLLDPSTRIDRRIINDSGNEVHDGGSSYFSRLIPVQAGLTLQPSFLVQRYYLYDSSKTFLRRTSNGNYKTYPYTVESGVCYVQVQIAAVTSGDLMLNFGNSPESYEAFKFNTDGRAYDGTCIVNSPNDETVKLCSWIKGVSSSLATSTHPESSILTVKAVTDTLDSIAGVTSFTSEGVIVTLQNELIPRIKALTIDDTATYNGQNIFDSSTRVNRKIKNNSGAEVEDSNSNYYSRYIPVADKTIKANFDIQKVYLYDSSKTFLSRSNAYSAGTEISFASNVNFVQIQVEVSKITNSMCIVYGDGDTTYKAFWESTVPTTHPNEDINIVGDGVDSISVNVEAYNIRAVVPAIKAYPMWEPTTVTDAYKCTPLGQSSQSIPALTDTLGYVGFLETYFDIYLGEYADGYSVTREDLGLDSGAEADGNIASPIYSYVFAPKNYSKTVLLSAGMNTCEASTFFGIAYFIKALMEHTEEGMLALYNSTRFVVIPVICPSGIAHDPLLYPNSNNVRINKNFEYYGSWERLKNDRGGTYPDSEVETKALKYWLNKYAGSTFWLDCHSDTGNGTVSKHLGTIFCSDSATAAKFEASKQEIKNFYIAKGYISASDNVVLGFSAQSRATAIYPKTVYGLEVTRIPSAMMEQFEYSTAWGSDGNTNNDQYAIKHYVAMIRYMVLIMCRSDQKIIFD